MDARIPGSGQPSANADATAPQRSVLESWKEIATYLHRSVRTVRRWERDEGLPVHRHLHQKLGTVYARRDEIDAWWDGRQQAADASGLAAGTNDRHGPARLIVAVLPFERLGGDASDDYLGEGLTEDVIVELGRLYPTRLGVIARTTVAQYRGTNRTIRAIGEELGVDFVLEGSVRREGDHVRVTARLVHVKDQAQWWAGSYEQTVRSILALQREIGRDIASAIHLTLPAPRHASLRAAPSVEPESYYAYLRGRHFLNRHTSESVQRSLQELRRAVALDPSHAAAHAALAEAYEQSTVWSDLSSVEMVPLAIEAAQKALALDPALAEAYASLGLIHANHVWDWSKAEQCFERALELNPSCSTASQGYAEYLGALGRTDQALRILDHTSRHDPLSLAIPSCRAFVLWMGRRFDAAITEAERVLAIDPRYAMALIRLGVAHAAKGMHDAAADEFRLAKEATPGLLAGTSLLGYALARAGRREEALGELAVLREQSARRFVPSFLLANIHLGLGDHDEALRLIEEEWRHRGWYLVLLRQSPIYDPLRSDPRFDALVSRMNFPA